MMRTHIDLPDTSSALVTEEIASAVTFAALIATIGTYQYRTAAWVTLAERLSVYSFLVATVAAKQRDSEI